MERAELAEQEACLWSLTGPAPALVLALRRLASGGLDDPIARHFLAEQFGGRYKRVLTILQVLLARVAEGARRRIAFNPLCCQELSADELALVDAMASGAAGDHVLAHASLAELIEPEEVEAVAAIAAALGEAVHDAGRPMHQRAEAARPTVH